MTVPTTTDAELAAVGWRFDNTYARLPESLFVPASPAAVAQPRVVILNHRLADELGLDLRGLSPATAALLFAGQRLPAGSQPIAQAYAGHQYGHFTMLGDGRALLVGEHRTPSGRLVDLQFKGSGPTRFSRRGDGRAALGPMLREYVISEAMVALGIPTTRSLAVVVTGEPVYRSAALRGAVLTRVAASHVRVGTFEYVAARQDHATLRTLTDYTLARHYPELVGTAQPALAFLRGVIDRQAALVAQWQLVGFIHGVMNTDNMAVSGETIDYGPCAFMNRYRPETVFSSIDHQGRYAYRNQPAIAQWNLTRFAETLLPLLDDNEDRAIALATEALGEFPARFERAWLAGMRRKLGLRTDESADVTLVQEFLAWMQAAEQDFTNAFRDLSEGALPAALTSDPVLAAWLDRWHARLEREGTPLTAAQADMRRVNPAVIPRNHRVEAALQLAEETDDLTLLHRLLAFVAKPFDSPTDAADREPSPDDDEYQTFCGT
jgi:uncharacterized protein YdiU (UPF0061 family)